MDRESQRPLPPVGGLKGRTSLRLIAEYLVVGVCTVVFVLTAGGICATLLGGHAAGTRDFVEYWASGHLLAHHANPYDRGAILGLERSVGFPAGDAALIMPNPPTALALVFPLGFLGPRAGELVWSLLLLASLVASVRMVWSMYGRPKNHLQVLGYSFGPALVCLMAGQISLLILLGLVLFLRLHRSSPFLAGVSLWLCLLKPHLFLPFGVVLLVWVMVTKSYRVFAGAGAALGVSATFALVFDPLVWHDYSQMMSAARIDRLPIPCLSVAICRALSPNSTWLQYLPAALGCAWALAYFRRHRDGWDWMEQGSLLMMVSVLVAPYSWLMDQAILVPAVLHAVYSTRSRSLLAVLALASTVIQVGLFRGEKLTHSAVYLWTAPAWLAWYLCAVRTGRRREACDGPSRAGGVPTQGARLST